MRSFPASQVGAGAEDHEDLIAPGPHNAADRDRWKEAVISFLQEPGARTIHLVGVGNPIKGDDSAGHVVVTKLIRKVGRRPRPGVVLHPPSSNPEGLLTKLSAASARLMIFDAVEAGEESGTVVCARLDDTRYGFFATHNLPLKFIPGLADKPSNTLIVGIQPESLEVGEGLTVSVQRATEEVVTLVARGLEAG